MLIGFADSQILPECLHGAITGFPKLLKIIKVITEGKYPGTRLVLQDLSTFYYKFYSPRRFTRMLISFTIIIKLNETYR